MQPLDEIDATVQATLGPFNKHKDVQYRVRCLVEKRLTGGEIVVIVVSFSLSNFFAGALAAAGKHLWDAIKRLSVKMWTAKSRKLTYRLEVTIKESIGKDSMEFKCSIDSHCKLDVLDLFRMAVEKVLSEAHRLDAHSSTGSKRHKNTSFFFDGKTIEEERN